MSSLVETFAHNSVAHDFQVESRWEHEAEGPTRPLPEGQGGRCRCEASSTHAPYIPTRGRGLSSRDGNSSATQTT